MFYDIDHNQRNYAKKVIDDIERKLYKDPENPYGVEHNEESSQDQYSESESQRYNEMNTDTDFYEKSSGIIIVFTFSIYLNFKSIRQLAKLALYFNLKSNIYFAFVCNILYYL